MTDKRNHAHPADRAAEQDAYMRGLTEEARSYRAFIREKAAELTEAAKAGEIIDEDAALRMVAGSRYTAFASGATVALRFTEHLGAAAETLANLDSVDPCDTLCAMACDVVVADVLDAYRHPERWHALG